MYALLKVHGNVEQAIRWAMELERRHEGENFADHNPCTQLYRLVETLNDLAGSLKLCGT